MRTLIMRVQRNGYGDGRPASGRAPDGGAPAHAARAILEAGEPETAASGAARTKSDTGVRHRQTHATAHDLEPQRDVARLRMLSHIRQRFAGDPEQLRLDVR